MRPCTPCALLALMVIGACTSNAPLGPSSRGLLDGGGSDSWSTSVDAPPATPAEGATEPDDGTLDDATSGDPTLADATLADRTVADITGADTTLSDGTFPDGSTADAPAPPSDASPDDSVGDAAAPPFDVSPDGSTEDAAAPPPEASAPDGSPDGPPGDALLDAGAPPVDAMAPSDAGEASFDDAAADGSSVVVPTTTDGGDYLFTSGLLSLELEPRVGGRIVSFALGGQNVLTGPDANATNYGSTFWTSPQSDWNWPPPPEIDNQPYVATLDGGALTLQGGVNGALGVAATKVFSFDPARGSVSITYTIQNAGPSGRSLAPWEVTRVRLSGLMFFPTGQSAYSADSGPPLPTQQASGVTWFDADAASITANIKFFADAARGWIAQESGGVVFVKKFVDPPFGSQAPGEAPIELFVSGDRAYVELEEQGADQPIAAGSSLSWTVKWFLTTLPTGVDAGLGSPSLVAFVDAL